METSRLKRSFLSLEHFLKCSKYIYSDKGYVIISLLTFLSFTSIKPQNQADIILIASVCKHVQNHLDPLGLPINPIAWLDVMNANLKRPKRFHDGYIF